MESIKATCTPSFQTYVTFLLWFYTLSLYTQNYRFSFFPVLRSLVPLQPEFQNRKKRLCPPFWKNFPLLCSFETLSSFSESQEVFFLTPIDVSDSFTSINKFQISLSFFIWGSLPNHSVTIWSFIFIYITLTDSYWLPVLNFLYFFEWDGWEE